MWVRLAPARSRLVASEWRAWWATQRPMSRLPTQFLKPLWNQLQDSATWQSRLRKFVGNSAIAARSPAVGGRLFRSRNRSRVLRWRASSSWLVRSGMRIAAS